MQEEFIIEQEVQKIFEENLGIDKDVNYLVERFLTSYFVYGKSINVAVDHTFLGMVHVNSSVKLKLEEVLSL